MNVESLASNAWGRLLERAMLIAVTRGVQVAITDDGLIVDPSAQTLDEWRRGRVEVLVVGYEVVEQ